MRQLSGIDASFLYMETDTNFGHTHGLFLYERPSPDFDPVAAVRAKYGSLVGELEPLRNRLVEVPFGLDHPYWVEDPHFDLDYHIRALNLPKPGNITQLADQVARIAGRPLDRNHPLWEIYVIDGLENDNWALLLKVHHSAVDGTAGQMILNASHETEPDALPPTDLQPWDPETAPPVPSDADMMALAVGNLTLNPYKAAQAWGRVATEMAERAGVQQFPNYAALMPPQPDYPEGSPRSSSAPSTPWNKTITRHRRIALAEASLENIKRLKNATGATVNDIVLAISAGALREYLLAHNALPSEPLRTFIPVSIRPANDSIPWTNRISAILADLPTDCADPLERVARCKATMIEAKRQHELVPAEALADLNQFSSPVLAAAASRLTSQLRLADHIQPTVNLVISNVPGPRQPLYLGGARLLHQFPISLLSDGLGLNITFHSYRDTLDFGFTADRELVPDLWYLADLHLAEITKLFEATGAEWATPPKPSLGPESAVPKGAHKVRQPATRAKTTKQKSSPDKRRAAASTRPAKQSAAAPPSTPPKAAPQKRASTTKATSKTANKAPVAKNAPAPKKRASTTKATSPKTAPRPKAKSKALPPQSSAPTRGPAKKSQRKPPR